MGADRTQKSRNEDDDKVLVIHRPNTLKMKVGGEPDGDAGRVDEVDFRRAEAVVAGRAATYPARIREQLDGLQEAHRRAVTLDATGRAGEVARIGALAHEIRGAAGTYGYGTIGKFATSLYDFTAGWAPVSDDHLAVIKIHIDAIRAMVRERGAAEGGPEAAELATSLRLAIQRISKRGKRG